MNKDLFISMVSKIDQTFEDEFKAEYNSPELIWDKIICKLTSQSPVICTCPPEHIFFNGQDCKCDRCGVEILFSKMKTLKYNSDCSFKNYCTNYRDNCHQNCNSYNGKLK